MGEQNPVPRRQQAGRSYSGSKLRAVHGCRAGSGVWRNANKQSFGHTATAWYEVAGGW